ncbi:hypothetical protein RHGRI_002105 [Rhododendron griersonianum]|uniref:DRBM domain-containing protein n=1 Tax=Rhododendron griersonianum TaxID=479676 RepID=A0AAV6LNN2_9ERIC|nr:hypothetical protein RHGRI_002105 [Rhododendron griersonianum]
MYKTKLQEVCQGNKWGLPKYSCIKDGPDHAPHFRASVYVNGVSFDSPSVSKSSKHALNEAAMLAFLHFASPDIQPVAEGADTEETHMSSIIPSNESDVKVGKQHKYKMQLQNYAQSKTLDPPLYSSKSEGPPHALQFQATVTIDGHSFDSLGHFRTLKEAEHVAARVALMSLSSDSFQEASFKMHLFIIDARLYKNLLQELAQSEGFTLPEYKTEKCGPPHMLTFFSTVEVEGEIFRGKGGKSHKLAEQNAAKVAYTAFVERKSTRCGDLTSGGSSEEEMLKCSPSPDPSKEFVKQAEETNGSDEEARAAFVEKWIQAHIQDSKTVIQKPILLSEFGKSSKSAGYSVAMRDNYFQSIYNTVYTCARTGGPCGGGLFWQLLAPGMDNFRDGYEVVLEESPSTASVIAQQSQKLSALES